MMRNPHPRLRGRAARTAGAVTPPVAQRGGVAIWFLFMLTVLVSIGAFAIDVPRIVTVSAELRNGADAAALAGAVALPTGTAGPNWSAVESAATRAIALNTSDGNPLTSGTVRTGYWNLAAEMPTIMAPATVSLPTPMHVVPAVQVTVARSASANGGLVKLLLGGLLGTPTIGEGATAVAVIAAPSLVPPGTVFPVVLDHCVYEQYWDPQTNQPKRDPSGKPYLFRIGNGSTYGASCYAGQWTSFFTSTNNVPTIRDLMQNGNPSPISIGDSIWLQPGVKDTIYSSVPTNVTVVVPVASQVSSKSYVPVIAFAAFHVVASEGGGSNAYIEGHFVGGYTIPAQASGVGPNYGAYVAPRLAH